MHITEVRIKLMEDGDDRLQAFCSITFDDCFVVRDLKIIEGANGSFVAMPSRKLTSHCGHCRCKNHLRAQFCNQCGSRLNPYAAARDSEGRAKLYADIAHPVNSTCREMIQDRVIAEFRSELERAKQPGYVSRYDDDFDTDFEPSAAGSPARAPERPEPQPAPPLPRPETMRFDPPQPPAVREAEPSTPTSSPELNRPHIQPAETHVRPPHQPPSRTSAAPPEKRTDRDFGAGILD